MPGDTHRNLTLATKLDNITWKHVLLPVWVAAYQYKGKSFRFLVNGETGEVSGESPLSWFKILGLLILYFLLVLLVVSGLSDSSALGVFASSVMVTGFSVFAVGTPIALSHLYRSRDKSHRAIYEFYQQIRS